MGARKHVVCLLSGSIDSTLAAFMMKKKGHEISCLHLRNKLASESSWAANCERVETISQALEAPVHHVHFDDSIWDNFTQNLLKDYKRNLVPDWSVAFNSYILMDSALTHAIEQLGADAVATGHYARTSFADHIFTSFVSNLGNKLMKAVDLKYDQSFLLSQIAQKNLQKVIFPLGEFNREIIDKVVSCTTLRDLPDDIYKPKGLHYTFEENLFLEEIKAALPKVQRGDFVTINSRSLHLYTIGQEVSIDGRTFYIVDKNLKDGTISVVDDPEHPAFYCDTMFLSLAHWSYHTPYNFFEKQMMNIDFKYGSPESPVVKGTLTVGMNNEYCGNDHLILSSSKPVRAINPGSHVALYQDEHCIGGAIVLRPGASQYAMNYHKFKDHVKPEQTNFARVFSRLWSKLSVL